MAFEVLSTIYEYWENCKWKYIVNSLSMLLAYIINCQRYNYEKHVCLLHVHVNRLLWIALLSYIKLFSPQSKQYTNTKSLGRFGTKQIMQIHFCLFFGHQKLSIMLWKTVKKYLFVFVFSYHWVPVTKLGYFFYPLEVRCTYSAAMQYSS